jgi:DNA-damage-inducible protein D
MEKSNNELENRTIKLLDTLKHKTDKGIEFWYAREIQPLLEYSDWENFNNVIDKAKVSCSTIKIDPDIHFVNAKRSVKLAKGAKRETDDIALTRLACYLIAMNAESSKPAIAESQHYFAGQTYKQELFDKLTETQKRLIVRDRVKDRNKELGGTAKDAGVSNWALFQEAGHQGLYGGLGTKKVKEKKDIPEKESLLDCIGHEELAIHEFRITQTNAKLKREKTKGDYNARETHREVGREVRNTIKKIGGTMPEDLPAEPSIKRVKKLKEIKELPDSST